MIKGFLKVFEQHNHATSVTLSTTRSIYTTVDMTNTTRKHSRTHLLEITIVQHLLRMQRCLTLGVCESREEPARMETTCVCDEAGMSGANDDVHCNHLHYVAALTANTNWPLRARMT